MTTRTLFEYKEDERANPTLGHITNWTLEELDDGSLKFTRFHGMPSIGSNTVIWEGERSQLIEACEKPDVEGENAIFVLENCTVQRYDNDQEHLPDIAVPDEVGVQYKMEMKTEAFEDLRTSLL